MRIVAGKFRGKALLSPGDESVRPTSDRAREAMFNILASRIGVHLDGLKVLDLFAGTGALGLEALSRGAQSALFVAKLLRRDATALGPAGNMGPFDLVFLDPPYNKGLGELALTSLRDGNWLAENATIVLEEASEATVTLPAGFTLDDRREYGAAALHFIEPTK